MDSLFGNDFEIKVKEPDVKTLVKKANKKEKEKVEVDPEKLLKSKKIELKDKLEIIKTNVLKVLGKQKDNILVIKDRKTFDDYIDNAIKSGRIAIDTETNNSLIAVTAKLMGLCLYYPGGKQAYIPVNHRNPDTKEKLSWQMTEKDCQEELKKIVNSKIDIVMHNGKFDYKVLFCTCGIEVIPTWDTMIAAKLLDENEFSAGLKQQYISKIDPTQEKYSIDHLFNNVEYADVDPDIFAYYSATDSMMTDKLYLWQKPRLEATKNEPGPRGKSIYDLFKDIEMPCVISTAKMELNGILFDKEYANRLKIKFEAKLKDIDSQIAEILNSYELQISKWKADPENNKETLVYVPEKTKMTEEKIEQTYPFVDANGKRYKKGKSRVSQLENPINLASPTQLAILFYDILKLEDIDNRGTGEEVLEKLKKKIPLAKLLLERRGVVKLLDAFILALPENVIPETGKIHCNFNQYGAATGRFSCSDPNLQQIPSHMKSIRMLFMADPGYKLIGSDFSQQEVRVLAELSQDKNLIEAYKNNKDIYATVASGVYHMDYWDCMEHHQDGSANPEGKKRRASTKSIVLGIMYSRGAAAIAEQIHSTKEEAQDIIDNFYKAFPRVKEWMDESLKSLKEKGYVEDIYGRRRRLPDINLKPATAKFKSSDRTFNPLLNCQNISPNDNKILESWASKMKMNTPNRVYEQLAKEALKYGIILQANTGRIKQAERQCVNAKIQSSSATMTKRAMNLITNDPELNSYGFKLCIGVHDELIGEVKEEYAKKGAARLCEIMKNCMNDLMSVGFKCDPSIVKKWYEDEVAYQLQDTLKELIASGKTEQEAKNIIIKDNSEFLPKEIDDLLAFKG